MTIPDPANHPENEHGDLNSAEDYFQQWLAAEEQNEFPSKRKFLESVPAEMHQEVSKRLDSYLNFRNNLLRNTVGMVPGRQIGGFKLIRELGSGGVGVVWEAEEIELRRRVALKILPPLSLFSTTATERFINEGKLASAMRHPNIVQILSVGQNDGLYWIALDLIENGRTMAHKIKECTQDISIHTNTFYKEIASQFASICDALAQMHDVGVVHMDIKPQNILLNEAGTPFITDFGMAQSTELAAISISQNSLGTPAYMSPEQLSERKCGITSATDIFSLGISLYECLCWVRPFIGDTKEQVANKILYYDQLWPRLVRSQIPRELEILCLSMLDKSANKRPSAKFLREEFKRFVDGEPIKTHPPSIFRRTVLWAERRPWRAIAVLLLLLVSYNFVNFTIQNAKSLSSIEESILRMDEMIGVWDPAMLGGTDFDKDMRLLESQVGFARSEYFATKPNLKVKLLNNIGRGYMFKEKHLVAKGLLEEAYAIIQQNPQIDAEHVISNKLYLGWSYGRTGNPEIGLKLLQEIINDPSLHTYDIRKLWARNRSLQSRLAMLYSFTLEQSVLPRKKIISDLYALERDLRTVATNGNGTILPMTYVLQGVAHGGNGDFKRAIISFQKADDYYVEKISPHHPERFYCFLGIIQNFYGAYRSEESLNVAIKFRDYCFANYAIQSTKSFECFVACIGAMTMSSHLLEAEVWLMDLEEIVSQGRDLSEHERQQIKDLKLDLAAVKAGVPYPKK